MRKARFRKNRNPTSLRYVLRDELWSKHRNAQTVRNREETKFNYCANSTLLISRGKCSFPILDELRGSASVANSFSSAHLSGSN